MAGFLKKSTLQNIVKSKKGLIYRKFKALWELLIEIKTSLKILFRLWLRNKSFDGESRPWTVFVWEHFCIQKLPITCRFQKYIFLKNRNFDKISGFWQPGKFKDVKYPWYHIILDGFFHELRKILKNGQFGAKPDPGQDLFGKKGLHPEFSFWM